MRRESVTQLFGAPKSIQSTSSSSWVEFTQFPHRKFMLPAAVQIWVFVAWINPLTAELALAPQLVLTRLVNPALQFMLTPTSWPKALAGVKSRPPEGAPPL